METWELCDLFMTIRAASEAHAAVAHSCACFNDRDGDCYHSGMASAFDEVLQYLKQRLSELDSESGR